MPCRNDHHSYGPSVRRSCHGRPLLAVRPAPPCRLEMSSTYLGSPHLTTRVATVPRPRPFALTGNPSREPSTENSIASRRTHAPHRVQSNRVSASARDAKTLNSFACARLSHPTHDVVTATPFTITFTTAAFDRSSLWLFEASPYRATPKGQPSSLVQHDAFASS
jgi:hypothetical protein